MKPPFIAEGHAETIDLADDRAVRQRGPAERDAERDPTRADANITGERAAVAEHGLRVRAPHAAHGI